MNAGAAGDVANEIHDCVPDAYGRAIKVFEYGQFITDSRLPEELQIRTKRV
jgi:hypothetical protein